MGQGRVIPSCYSIRVCRTLGPLSSPTTSPAPNIWIIPADPRAACAPWSASGSTRVRPEPVDRDKLG
jgi:hypothetical protein